MRLVYLLFIACESSSEGPANIHDHSRNSKQQPINSGEAIQPEFDNGQEVQEKALLQILEEKDSSDEKTEEELKKIRKTWKKEYSNEKVKIDKLYNLEKANIFGKFGKHALFYLAEGGKVNSMNYLIGASRWYHTKRTKIPLTKTDSFGNTVLHLAVQQNQIKVVEKFSYKTCDVKRNPKNEDGYTLIHMAAEYGRDRILQILMHRPMLYERNNINKKCEFNLLDQTEGELQTALHLAAKMGHTEVVQLLIADTADQHIENTEHETPLDLAAQRGHYEIVKILITKKINTMMGYWGKKLVSSDQLIQAFFVAIKNNQPRIMKLLYEQMDKVEKESLLSKLDSDLDKVSESVLYKAIQKDNLFIVQTFLNLLKESAFKNVQPKILGFAWLLRKKPFLKKLTNSKEEYPITIYPSESCDTQDQTENKTVYHLAAERGLSRIPSIPTECISQLSNKDKEGQTALHLAAYFGHADVVQLLLNGKADQHIKNHKNLTPLDLAIQQGNTSIVEILAGQSEVHEEKQTKTTTTMLIRGFFVAIENNQPLIMKSLYDQMDETTKNSLVTELREANDEYLDDQMDETTEKSLDRELREVNNDERSSDEARKNGKSLHPKKNNLNIEQMMNNPFIVQVILDVLSKESKTNLIPKVLTSAIKNKKLDIVKKIISIPGFEINDLASVSLKLEDLLTLTLWNQEAELGLNKEGYNNLLQTKLQNIQNEKNNEPVDGNNTGSTESEMTNETNDKLFENENTLQAPLLRSQSLPNLKMPDEVN